MVTVGRPYADPTEAFVAEASTAAGEPAVLKLVVPSAGSAAADEITALRLADGECCARLLRSDASRGALLLERLGRPMSELRLPLRRRHEILCDLANRIWRAAPDRGLQTGAVNGRWLCEFIVAMWEALDRPIPERTVAHALACAERRIAAHNDARAVLVPAASINGTPCSPARDSRSSTPDGLLAEPEYDLAIIMREDPLELLRDGPHARAAWLAARTALDMTAIWGVGCGRAHLNRPARGVGRTPADRRPDAPRRRHHGSARAGLAANPPAVSTQLSGETVRSARPEQCAVPCRESSLGSVSGV